MELDDTIVREIEEYAVELASGAGRILDAYFGKALDVEFKDKDQTNPVSEADKKSEEYLKEAIKARFPDHSILGEEGTNVGPAHSDFLWTLDPLDGTLNYINGLAISSVSIGVLHKGTPVVGSIWMPSPGMSQGSVYHARRGYGAYRDGVAISVRKNPVPQAGQLAVTPGGYRRMYRRRAGRKAQVGEIRNLGSIAYEMALASSGVLQYAVFTSPSLWDIAAGVILVREAGGAALTYNRRRNRWEHLASFPVPDLAHADALAELRKWRAPIIVGNGELIEYLAQFLRPGRLARLIRRLGRI